MQLQQSNSSPLWRNTVPSLVVHHSCTSGLTWRWYRQRGSVWACSVWIRATCKRPSCHYSAVFIHHSVSLWMSCLPSCCAARSGPNLIFTIQRSSLDEKWWADEEPLLFLCTYLHKYLGVAVADGHVLHLVFRNTDLTVVWATLQQQRMWCDRNCRHK